MVRHFITSLLLAFTSLNLYPQTTKVVYEDGNPVIAASVEYLSADSTERGTATTDSMGICRMKIKKYPAHVNISAIGISDTTFVIKDNSSHPSVVVLKEEPYKLQEVIITQDVIKQYTDHTSYNLYERDKKRYSSMLQALNEIPFLNVDSEGSITYRGQSDVVLLLNGRQSSAEEIRAIRKEDITKVDVYENPPARFALAGANVVVDLRTKQTIRGGNISLNLNDAVTTMKGENAIAAFYNWGNSQLSFMGNSSLHHYDKVVENEEISYEYDDMQYKRTKRGKESPNNTDLNDLSIGYAYNKPHSFQFYANWKSAFYKQKNENNQMVSDNLTEYESFRSLNSKYTNHSLNLYFNKEWQNNRSFVIDVTGTIYNTDYHSYVKEGDEVSFESYFESYSQYDIDRKSLIASTQYSQLGWLGTWTIGINENYQQSYQHSTDSRLRLRNNTAYGFIQLYGQKQKFYYQLTMALKHINVRKDDVSIWNKWSIAPAARLTWRPTNYAMLSLGYNYLTNVPAVSLLSETVQWLDSHYIYKGNSDLSPYSLHQMTLYANITPKHFAISLIGLYTYSPDAIINVFEKTPDYIVQTYDNMDYQTSYGGQVMIDYFPLQNKALKLGMSGIYLWNHAKEVTGGSWAGHRYQFSAYISVALRKWEAQASYQYPGQTMQGQLVTPRTEYIRLDISYKPTERLAIGLQWNQPFMHALKEGEHTTKDAIVTTKSEKLIRDFSNMICVKLSYNLSFGNSGHQQKQKIKNADSDSGLLVK